jgi:translation initiation factor IF-2
VTSTRDKRPALVFGSRVTHGSINVKNKFRVISVGGQLIIDNLEIKSLNQHKTSLQSLEKGNECGISLERPTGKKQAELFDSISKGDHIECYEEKEAAELKFDYKAGLHKTYQ